MIVRQLVLSQYQRVMDRWTDTPPMPSTAEHDRNVLNLTA